MELGGDSEKIPSLHDGFLLNNSAKHSKNRGVAVMAELWRNCGEILAELPGGATLCKGKKVRYNIH